MKFCRWMDPGPPTWHCYLRGIIMDDIYVNGEQVNKNGPVRVKGTLIHPFCQGVCKELVEMGEDVLIQERGKEYDEMLASWSL